MPFQFSWGSNWGSISIASYSRYIYIFSDDIFANGHFCTWSYSNSHFPFELVLF